MPGADRRTFADAAPSEYPGERLGLPQDGRLSIGRSGRRIAALAVDFALSALISFAFFDYDRWASLLLFVLLQAVFIPTIGGSPGHRLLGMRVIRLGGGWVGVWRPLVRSVLLAVLVPALVWDSDQRGFHDKVAGTVLVRY
ncbi:RDD family protein [Rathayibacter iranicus]|uniref:RDD family protein n=2 Tax=Rathayibacter iranicus TaxID=59737 RepID=A0AAD1EM73_9MICO|nr:RDD family protein [Rathayibacter iranicus]AZZ55259.1 RDD family protein [Rathayibacter iranicus]MWV31496.1 RDD family protein [Rathayibacter iranicus NCPPB 2253 = VKM Ac-1602]PPI49216.1 RDD family protein [Rathayibacter iranicus]PPI61650.1 RDD family protein [Rathayibacter iranicus]PPI72277.1 RDD family protein [Rathayibacter iranicus]